MANLERFDFYIDEKCEVWIRNIFNIEAESYDDAVRIMKRHFKTNCEVDFESCETLYETSDMLEPLHSATKELFNDNDELLMDNWETSDEED